MMFWDWIIGGEVVSAWQVSDSVKTIFLLKAHVEPRSRSNQKLTKM